MHLPTGLGEIVVVAQQRLTVHALTNAIFDFAKIKNWQWKLKACCLAIFLYM